MDSTKLILWNADSGVPIGTGGLAGGPTLSDDWAIIDSDGDGAFGLDFAEPLDLSGYIETYPTVNVVCGVQVICAGPTADFFFELLDATAGACKLRLTTTGPREHSLKRVIVRQTCPEIPHVDSLVTNTLNWAAVTGWRISPCNEVYQWRLTLAIKEISLIRRLSQVFEHVLTNIWDEDSATHY